MKHIKIIYFAHAYKDYDTDYEYQCYQKIHNWCESNGIKAYYIINPGDVEMEEIHGLSNSEFQEKLKKDMEEIFFPLIDLADIIIIAKASRGMTTDGVNAEKEYSIQKGKEVVYLDDIKKVATNEESLFDI